VVPLLEFPAGLGLDHTLEQLHRDRVEAYASFETLAEKYSPPGHRISESSVRRHFRRHVSPGQYSPIATPNLSPPVAAEPPTLFDPLVGQGQRLTPRVVLEASTAAIIQKLRDIEREYQMALGRSPQQAERALAKFLKTHALLEHALARLEEARKPRQQLWKAVGDISEKMVNAMADAYAESAKENAAMVRGAINDFLLDKLRPSELVRRIERFEWEWTADLANKVQNAGRRVLREAQGSLP